MLRMPSFVLAATGNLIDPTGNVTRSTMVTTLCQEMIFVPGLRACRGRSLLNR